MFGGNLQVSGKLLQQMNNPNLTVQHLFQIPNIIGDIKQNIQLFFVFCLKRKQFTTQMLQICLNSEYQIFQSQINKKIAYNVSQLLSYDQDAFGKFIFSHQQQIKSSSQISQKIDQQIEDIVNDAEHLFEDDQQNNKNQWKMKPDVFDKFQLIKITLKILKNPQKNQSSLGYINKIYSSLLRRSSTQFLQFLSLNKQYLDMILNAINYQAIGSFLNTILSAQDKSGQYRYQYLKKQIFQQILKITFSSIQNRQKFEGILMMIQEIINTTKQSYYEYFDDFKRCANVLVSQQTLKKFLVFVKKRQGNSFKTALSYLQLVLRRINIQNNQNQNDYYRQNESNPSMNFQYTFLYSEIDIFIKIGYEIIQGQKEPFKKMLFFSFLLELFKNKQGKQVNLDYLKLFKNFIKMLILEKSNGIIKNYIYQLVDLFLVKIQNIKQAINWLFFHSDQEIIQQIKKLNLLDDVVNINKNLNNCYIQKIIFSLNKKFPQFVELQPKQMIKLKLIINKYSIKLAKQEENQQKYFLMQEDFKLQLPIDNLKNKKVEQTTFGKNNITIPSLNISSINEQKIVVEQQQVKQVQITDTMSKQVIIQNLKNTKLQLDKIFKKNEEEIAPEQNKQNQFFQIKQSGLQFFTRHIILF